MTEDEMNEQLEAMRTAHEAEKESILTKNRELLAREQAAKKATTTATAEREQAVADAALKSGDIEVVKTQMQTLIDAEKARADAAVNILHSTIADREIQTGLTANNFKSHAHTMILKSLKADGVTVVDGVAMVGDKTVAAYLKDFAKSEDGKHFVAPPQSGGTGLAERGATTPASQFTKENFNMTDWFKLYSDPATTEMAKSAAIRCDRKDLLG